MDFICELKYNNIAFNLYEKNLKNPYCVYLPKKINNKIIECIYINEEVVTLFLYKHFINNIKDKTSFINWIYSLNGINKSNWFVVINKMYKKNLLN